MLVEFALVSSILLIISLAWVTQSRRKSVRVQERIARSIQRGTIG